MGVGAGWGGWVGQESLAFRDKTFLLRRIFSMYHLQKKVLAVAGQSG